MTIKTSHWFATLPADHCKIGISRGFPRGIPAGYRLFKALAPGPWFNSVSIEEYRRRYRAEILDWLDPAEVVVTLRELAGTRVPVMVCFERPGDGRWCHRAMAAKWIHDLTGQPVPEFGFEHLPQGEHPLLPKS